MNPSTPAPDEPTAVVFDVRRGRADRGPARRTVLLFKGCPLRCSFCHHPEGIDPAPELLRDRSRCSRCEACAEVCPEANPAGADPLAGGHCRGCGRCAEVCTTGARSLVGRRYGLDELLQLCLQDRVDFAKTGGGVTLSGGEPMMQWRFLEAFLPRLHADGVHVALETSGCYPWYRLSPLLEHIGHIYLDYKLPGDQGYRRHAQGSHGRTLQVMGALVALGFPMTVRVPAIPALNTHPKHIGLIASILIELGVREIQLLRYDDRWERTALGLSSRRPPLGLSPDDVDLERLAAFYAAHGVVALKP